MSTIKLSTIKAVTVVVLVACTALILWGAYQSAQQQPVRSLDYKILQSWEMPRELDEISGIAWLGDQLIACVQDEDGVIFIFDLNKQVVIDQIPFSRPGDFEGISVMGADAYVMRSDGKIYKVARFRESENPTTTIIETKFTRANNMETLTLSQDSTALITVPKDRDSQDNFKGLYRINPQAGTQAVVQPMIEIDMQDDAFQGFLKKKPYRTFSPSDAAFHPITGELYILEGIQPKMIIMNTDGIIQKVIEFTTDQFRQPEGIAISPTGRIFIANEADGGVGTIVEIALSNYRN